MQSHRLSATVTCLVTTFGLLAVPCARAAETAPAKVPLVPWTLPTLFKRVPTLKHNNVGRYPMICWDPFQLNKEDKSFSEAKPFPPATIRELVRRGLTQWIPPDEKYIPYALALQKEGAGVIMIQGASGNMPADLGPDPLHKLPADFKKDDDPQTPYACPMLQEGWKIKAGELRALFAKYKAAGVKLDAVWLDWEIEPFAGKPQWLEAKECSRCQKLFPAGALDDLESYRAFITLQRMDLFSAYVVAPILENYPGCSVNNWDTVASSVEHPTQRWSGATTVPPTGLGMFTAANPVAYGNTAWYGKNWKQEWGWPLDEAHMDRLYTQVMLGQVSGNEINAKVMSPEKQSIPWVDRFCPDDSDEKIPILSRPRYREILRHCWLRGVDGMQIFNHMWFPDRADRLIIMTEEVEDAVAIYDEMLAYRPFLERGVTINNVPPKAPDDGPIWSGLRLEDRAIVRTFTQASKAVPVTITPFPSADGKAPTVQLDCPPKGATYLLTRKGDTVRVKRQ